MFLKIDKAIQKYNKIYLLRHQKPDFDALASQLGLYEILRERYNDKEIIPYGKDKVDDFSFMGENKFEDGLVIKDSLIIILDTANKERIDGNSYEELKNNNNYIIKIDHHPNLEPFGDINIVEEFISSTSELVYKIFVRQLKYSINTEAARLIYTGIYGDTGGFSYSSTSAQTLEIASELVKFDFDFEELMLNIKEEDEQTVKALGWLYQNIVIENGLGILKFDKKTLESFPYEKKNLSMLVNYLGIFNNIKAWALMIEYDTFIRVNLRSKRNINVSKLANQYRGGGHKNASGARVFSWYEADNLIEELKKII